MTPSLAALAAVDFRAARDVWADPPCHVDDLHGDVADRIIAEFFVRTRAGDSNPLGQILSGAAGAGKTHLLGTLRRRVWQGGGWFVSLDVSGAADFWRTAALGFVDSLSRRLGSGQTQAGAALIAAVKTISADPAVRQAAARARPRLAEAGPVDLMLALLAAAAPAETQRHADVVRALALLESRDLGVGAVAGLWLQGEAAEAAKLGALGFLKEPPAPVEIVRGLLWLLGLGGPTLIAVERLDAVASEAAAGGAGANRAAALLQAIAQGLSELHDVKRRALTLLCCLEPTWAVVKQRTPAPVTARFREPRALAPVASPLDVEKLIETRLRPAYDRVGFAPPYPTYPFPRAALAGGVGMRPGAILLRAEAHRELCLAERSVRECAALDGDAPAPAAEPPSGAIAALDAEFARLRAGAGPPDLGDEAAQAALLGAAVELCLRQFKLPETVEGVAVVEADRRDPALDARLAFIFHGDGGRERRYGFRVLTQQNVAAFPSRLRAAMTASGIEAGLPGRELIILRAEPPPPGEITGALVRAFLEAGGRFVEPAAEDFALFATLRRLSQRRDPYFDAWLRLRAPLLESNLFRSVGLAAPDFLGARSHPQTASPPPPEPEAPRSAASGDASFAVAALSPELLSRQVAIFAQTGPARSALVARIVQEAALVGTPSLIVGPSGAYAALGEPWPSRPAGFTDEDAQKAKAFRERVEVVVWTPGAGGARPLALPPLPDFAALSAGHDAESLEERERAVEMALGSLEPFLFGGGAKAIKLRGTLADGLRAFARAGGGALDDLVRLLGDLPENASRIADAPELAREIAGQLLAAMATDPQMQPPAFDPATLFAGADGRTRVSVVDLSGLESDAARASFVHRLQMSLFVATPPAPGPRLYVMDEAQAWTSPKETTPARRSALALASQGRRRGLGLILSSAEPRGIDPAILAQCRTLIFGPLDSPEAREAAPAMAAARWGEEAQELAAGEFHVAAEGRSPAKFPAPPSLSRLAPQPQPRTSAK